MNIPKYIRALLLLFLMLLLFLPVQAEDGLRVANLIIHTDHAFDIYPNHVGTNPIFSAMNGCPIDDPDQNKDPDVMIVHMRSSDDWSWVSVAINQKTGQSYLVENTFKERCKTPAECMNQVVQTCMEKASNDVVFRTCMWDVLDTAITNHFQSICTTAGYSSLSDCLSVISNQDLLNKLLASCADVCKSAASGCSACFLEKITEEKEKAAEEVCTAYCRDSADPDCMEDCIKLIDLEGITVIIPAEDPGVQDFPEPSEEILRDIQEMAEKNMLGTKTYEATYYHFPSVQTSGTEKIDWDFFGSENNFIVHFQMEWDPDEADSAASSCGVFGRWADYRDYVTMSMDRTGWAEIKSTVKGSAYVNNSGRFVRVSDPMRASFTVGLVERNASVVYNGSLSTYSKNITLDSGSWGLMHLSGGKTCAYYDIEILVLE